VSADRRHPLRRAAGEQPADLFGQLLLESLVRGLSPLPVPLTATGTGLLIGQALLLGLLDRSPLDQ
jgi:hypothetical protein